LSTITCHPSAAGADHARDAAAIVDDHLPPKRRGEPFRHDAPHGIDTAAGRERHDQGNRAGRIGLRPCDPRYRRERDSARCQMQE
jgi:hypothetical protein